MIGLYILPKPGHEHTPPISVIVAARNEEENIGELLTALTIQDYPIEKFEIIIVDDRSTDRTAEIVNQRQVSLSNLRLVRTRSEMPDLVGKKNALTAGIRAAKYERLLFTDADCLPPPGWLRSTARYFTDQIDVAIGYSPHDIPKKSPLIATLRRLERLAMSAVYAGAAGWNIGIGAAGRNLAYRKSLFEKVDGFRGIGHLHSGDDDLFVQKLNRYKSVRFAFVADKSASVPTQTPVSKRVLYEQEKRRHSKIRYYPIWLLAPLIFVAGFYLQLAFLFFAALGGVISWKFLLTTFGLKLIVDFMLLQKFAGSVGEEKLLLWLFPAEVLHLPYLFTFSILGNLFRYRWK